MKLSSYWQHARETYGTTYNSISNTQSSSHLTCVMIG